MSEELHGNIYDIQKFSVHDGPGIRTDVFLKGCPLKCLWCHSPESQGFGSDVAYMDIRCVGIKHCGLCLKACDRGAISESEPKKSLTGDEELTYPVIDRPKCDVCLKCVEACPSTAIYNPLRRVTVEYCMESIRKDKKYYEKSGGGVTISGGEPMSQFEFTLALAKACRAEGYNVALDTTGYAPTAQYMEILPYINLFLYDLKHMNSDRHQKLTGVPNELILKNAEELAKAGARFQIRFPIVPKLNDSEENIRATAEFCVKIKDAIDVVQLLPYHKMGSMKYTRLGKKYKLVNVEAPSDEFMKKQLELFESYGLKAMIH
ncbi:MAG: glycyl-radical enzyme activating protein [Papillibacter sp.]|nr:glycyl-radical enzyme activating protein [Papillibacter sp.]